MNPNPLTESDFDRLEELLDADVFAEAMRLDEIQAMLCAVVSGPEVVPPVGVAAGSARPRAGESRR